MVRIFLWLLLFAGATTFLSSAFGGSSQRAWQNFLINSLLWTGMAQAGPVFVSIHRLAEARWGQPIPRLAAGMAIFLPIGLLLFLFLPFGSAALFPQIPTSGGEPWLGQSVSWLRDGLGLLGLTALSLWVLFYSARPEQQLPRPLAASVLLVYGLVYSLLGVDLVRALDATWSSALFGAYFSVSNFYLGLAALAVLAVLGQRRGIPITVDDLHDLGKLLFGFCLLTGYFLWSQYLVIWYADVARETGFLLRRAEQPWLPLAIAALTLALIAPFLALLSRRVKRDPHALLAVSLTVCVGIWLERYLLVVPSIWEQPGLPLGWMELLITSGFFAGVALTYLQVLSRATVR
ncbi:MAG: hypothetical protein ACE5JU_06150 [Candidatus Binatia bacterium]